MDPLAGEWKTFDFRSVKEKDFPEVLAHLRDSFYKDEPTQRIGGTSEDRMTDLDNRITVFLQENMSFMAICKVTRKIAGLIIMTEESVDKKPLEQVTISPLSTPVRACMTQLYSLVNIFEKYGVSSYGCIYIVNVHQDFRKQGLGKEMFRRATEFLKGLNYPVLECTFSNPYSRRMGEIFGFVEVAKLKYCEAADKTGKIYFPNAPSDQFVNITVLDLRQEKQNKM